MIEAREQRRKRKGCDVVTGEPLSRSRMHRSTAVAESVVDPVTLSHIRRIESERPQPARGASGFGWDPFSVLRHER